MKLMIPAAAAFALLCAGAPAIAQDKSGDGGDALLEALHSAIGKSTPPGQNKRPADPDQGDDNASMRAISEVCTKGTPAADRSAICPRDPISPQ